MKEQNIIRMKCITILLFIILSVVLIVVGFSQEYRSSSLPYIMKKPSTAALTFSWAFSCLPIY